MRKWMGSRVRSVNEMKARGMKDLEKNHVYANIFELDGVISDKSSRMGD